MLRAATIVWTVVVMLLGAHLLVHLRQGVPIETNILTLLPDSYSEPLLEEAYSRFERESSKKVVLLVGNRSFTEAQSAAKGAYDLLQNSEMFARLQLAYDTQQRALFDLLFPYRHVLMTREQQQLLERNEIDTLIDQAKATLVSPLSFGGTSLLADDPLFFFVQFLRDLGQRAGAMRIEAGYLTVEKDGVQYIVITGTLKDSSFSIATQNSFQTALKEVREKILNGYPNSIILSAGFIQHAIAGTGSAKRDITTIGVGSLLGVVGLIVFTFRSIFALFLSFVPLMVGCIAAFSVSLLCFDKVHILTLVFGSSLIGVSIDYTFHFLAERLQAKSSWDARRGMQNILSGITIGLLTSLSAYGALALAPFPGLTQIALFSSIGLFAAYATVVLWYPSLVNSPSTVREPLILNISSGFLRVLEMSFQGRVIRFLGVLIVPLIAVGLVQCTFDDDIRLLTSSPPELIAEEQRVQEIMGSVTGSQFYIVSGETEEAVLIKEAAFVLELDKLIASGDLVSYRALSSMLPPPTVQQSNYRLLRKELLSEDSQFVEFLTETGFKQEVIDHYRSAFERSDAAVLKMDEILRSSISESYRLLWLGNTKNGFASIVVLEGVANSDSLRQLAKEVPGVFFISRSEDVSLLLSQYRRIATVLVILAYCLIFVLLLYRYRLKRALLVMFPPVCATIVALSLSFFSAIPLNLFSVLGLVLVLGIGIDYTIFFAEKKGDRETTMLAVLLSSLTTILSFGLLSLSSTPVIHSFGTVVFVGILISFLLAPIVGSHYSSER